MREHSLWIREAGERLFKCGNMVCLETDSVKNAFFITA